MKTCVIIPTYNESQSIANLIRQIRKQDLEVVVVDDGSKDNTGRIAQDNGAVVLRNSRNQGKGASLIKGFHYALNKNFASVITMDGDGQHLPEDIPQFMRLAATSNGSIFIGNRMHNLKCMPLLRLLTNKLMSWLISKVTRQEIPDSQCGFRLIKREVLEKLKLKSSKYEIESEILINASRLGFKIESVPVKTVYTGTKSRINPLTDTLRFIRFMTRQLWTTPY